MKENEQALTAERLREILDYDPSTGVFTCKVKYCKKIMVGDEVGSRHSMGYRQTAIYGHDYLLHRLAWLYVNGEWPKANVDHIDGDKTNNQIGNLRDCEQSTNSQNIKGPKTTNNSGFLGVSRSRGAWIATITTNGKQSYLGKFETPDKAHAAYIAAKRIHHPGCTI